MADKLRPWMLALALSVPTGLAMAASSALNVNVSVTVADPTVTALSSDINPSQAGQFVTFRATVISTQAADMPTPTGTVIFSIDGVPQAPATLDASAIATFGTASLAVGDHVIQAQYNGDGEGDASLSGQITQTVKSITTTTLTLLNSPSAPGVGAGFQVDVSSSAGVPTGTVNFTIDGTPQAPVLLTSGSVTLNYIFNLLGSHTILAQYAGDANFAPSDSLILSQFVQATPTVTLSSSKNPAQPGVSVTFTVQVDSTFGTPSGSVDFTIDTLPPSGASVTTVTLAGGVATLNTSFAAGTYSVKADYSGEADFNTGAQASLTQVISNASPVANDDSFTVQQDTSGNVLLVLANDSDADGDVLSITGFSAQTPAAATSGTLAIAPDSKSILYTPKPGFVGALTFTYSISDGHSGTASGTVSVDVAKVNIAPVFTSSPVTGATQGIVYSHSVTAVDANNDALTLTAIVLPAWLSFVDNGGGSGTLSGTPLNADVGAQNVALAVTDGTAVVLQNFTITVTDVDDAPILASIADTTVAQGQVLSIQAIATDIDPAAPNNTLTYSITGGTATWVSINGSTGLISGVAPNNGSGTVSVHVADGGGLSSTDSGTDRTFTITVLDTNNAPTIAAIADQTVLQGGLLSVTAVGSDVDPVAPNNTLTYSLLSAPSWVAIDSVTGDITGTAPNNGGGTVVVQVSDGGDPQGTAQTSFTVIVTDVNDAPTLAAIPNASFAQGQVLSIQAIATDIDPAAPNNALTYSITGGTATWVSIDGSTGLLSGVAPNNGSGTVSVHVADGSGLSSTDSGTDRTFTITVLDTNNAPTIAAIADQTVLQGGLLSVTAVGSDVDPVAPNNTLTYSLLSGPSWVAIDSVTGDITGTAPNNGGGTVVVEVSDGGDPQGTAMTSFTVIVTDVNDAPTLAAIPNASFAQGQVLSIQAIATDIDPAAPNNTLTYSITGGTVTWVSINGSTGLISGVAPNNGSGTVSVHVADGGGLSSTDSGTDRTFTITVLDTNNAPTIAAIADQTVLQGGLLSVTAVGSDVDPVAPNNTLTYSLLSAPSWISINPNSGAIGGTAPNNGGGTVVVEVSDGGNPQGTAQTSFNVIVTDVNDAPTIAGINDLLLAQGQGVNVQAVGSDIDPAAPNNALTYSLSFAPSVAGTPNWLSINSSSGFISGSAINKGSGTFTVTVTDGAVTPLSAQTSFTITVTDTNDPPTIAAIVDQTVVQGGTLSVAAAGADIDPAAPNNSLAYSLVSAPAWVSINASSGLISGTAPNNGGGTVVVRVTDGGVPPLSAQTSFNVVVTDVNDAPTIAAIADVTVAQGQSVSIQAQGGDIDPAAPNNALTYSLTGPSWLSINAASGLITGVAPINGGGTVTVKVTDGGAPPKFATAGFQMTVIGTVVTVSAPNGTATESGTANGSFTISRTGDTSAALTVTFTLGGSATEGSDYQAIGTSALILAGQSSVDITVSAKPDGVFEGQENVVLSLANNAAYLLGSQKQATVTILDNDAFGLTSGPTATPNPATVGQVVQFTAAANGSGATFAWDFGDGTTDTSGAATVTHSYSTPIATTVKVTATGAGGAKTTGQVSMTVNAAATPPPSDPSDSDGDGVSDDLEAALGTDPFSATSTPVTNARTPLPLTVSKMGISLSFATGGHDAIGLSGVLPIPTGFDFANKIIAVDVGGVVRGFVLNSKGKAKAGTSAFSIGIKPKAGLSKFSMKITKGTFADKLKDEKMTSTTVKALPITVTVNLIFNNLYYQKIQPQSYTAKQGKTGKSK